MYLPDLLRKKFSFLLHARNKRFFFETVGKIHPEGSPGYVLIKKAYVLIRHAFRGRRRRSGERESEHPIRCALVLMIHLGERDADRIAAMLLHDLQETFRDVRWIERIALMFNPAVAGIVKWLTKPPLSGELRTDADVDRVYYPLLEKAPAYVVCLKGVDRFDNLITYWRSPATTKRKVSETTHTIYRLMQKKRLPLASEMREVIKYLLHSAELQAA